MRSRHRHRAVQDAQHLPDLLLGHVQRGAEADADGARSQQEEVKLLERRLHDRALEIGGKALIQAHATNVPDHLRAVFPRKLLQAINKNFGFLWDLRNQPQLIDNLHLLGEPHVVRQCASPGRVQDALGDHGPPHVHHARPELLRSGDGLRGIRQVKQVGGKHCAALPARSLNFIKHETNGVFTGKFRQLPEKLWERHSVAASALNGLNEDGCDLVSVLFDQLFHLVKAFVHALQVLLF
mmetsp:Transcript_22603/g.56710  ORF Transcript_22603/g.56710 Transcript_22603/m.56710 type:complete len:239 (+) Transcript_22603:37-753(+)